MTNSYKGLIFDIRRFSTHDGDGIRTTIFLKGCPLKCIWCQNPEGILPTPKLVHFANKCIGCGTCLGVSDHAARMVNGKVFINAEKVQQGEKYEDVCPAAALLMDSKYYEIEAVMQIALRDMLFFKRGGGVTLSGGEPLRQHGFTYELLLALKKSGIHTAVETSLYVDHDYLKRVLPLIDLLFVDFKVADSAAHKAATGVDNALIRQNIEMVLRSPYRARAVVRTPLIPGYTATQENISAIASEISGLYPEVRYELLNYNPLAQAKYRHVDFKYCFEENPKMYRAEQMQEFYQYACDAGVRHLIMEE